MRRVASLAVLLALVVGIAPALAQAQAVPAPADPLRPLLDRLEQAVLTGTPAAYLALVSDAADRAAAQQFAAQHLGPGVTHVTIRERDRSPLAGTLPGNGYRVTADVFIQRGSEARLVTWRLDLRRRSPDTSETSSSGPTPQPEWGIVGQDVLGIVEGLRHLALDVTKELDAHDLVIHAEDFDLKLPSGQVFTAATREGTTALLLMGRGQMVFRPAPATERGQVKIFCGGETLDTSFDMAFVRVNPADLEAHLQTSTLVPRAAVDASDAKRANDFFEAELVQSFTLDLSEFSPESWSLLPPAGDFLTEVHTDRFGTLTYARSNADPEDITLFDRKHEHNIALYASKEKLATRGRFYNEDDLAEFEVEHYDVDASLDPARLWIAGRTQLTIRVRADSINHLTLKLADLLTIRSVFSQQYGRLLALRVRNQNSIVVNLPSFVTKDTQFSVTIVYAGRVPPQETTRETITVGQFPRQSPVVPNDVPRIDPEPSFLYSNQSFWYPQAPIDGYATATLRLTVPPDYQCVASGAMASGSPVALPATDTVPARKLYVFTATQPLRYLACVLSHFVSLATDPVTVSVPPAPAPKVIGDDPPPVRQPGVYYDSLKLSVEAPKRQLSQEQALQGKAADIAAFYASLLHDVPYPTFTVALVESNLPGGHSPGYFAVLNQPLPTTPFTWRHDPASFEDFPEFFLAHELAHQWWGQAIGPANYHEQWLSEGFAQYFAVLYAEHRRGEDVFDNILHKLRQWSIEDSDQGPIYLGYRLGHIKNDGRVYRALVYDKGAMVLHMLRRLLGDQTFFEGLRHFYLSSRFHKVGTDDLRKSMEAVAHRPLERFFDRWIYDAGIPHVTWSSRVDAGPHGPELVIHAEEQGSLVYDLPVTVTVSYSDKPAQQVVMPITDRVTDFRIPLTGQFRGVDLNRDDGSLGIFDKK